MLTKFTASVLAAATLAIAAPASATSVLITYTGTLDSGTDSNGVFGAEGGSLAGDDYTAVFTVDVSGETYGAYSGGYSLYEVFTISPDVLSAVLTINGHSVNYGASYGFVDRGGDNNGTSLQSYISQSAGYDISGNSSILAAPSDIATVGSYTNAASIFSFSYGETKGTASNNGAVSVALAPSAAPEPASWAMMLGGFGVIGAAMRRRRTSLTFA